MSLKCLAKWIGYFLCFLALLIGTGALLLRLTVVNDAILAYAKKEFERSTGWHLNARSMDRLSPISLRLKQVELTCPGSTIITADRISFTFAPHQLLLGRIVFPSITMHDVEVHPAPETTLTTDQVPNTSSFPMLLPFGVEVRKVRITNLTIPEAWKELLPLPASQLPRAVNVTGKLEASTLRQTGSIELSVEDVTHLDNATTITMSGYHDNGDVYLNTRIAEEGGGIVQGVLALHTPCSMEFFADTKTSVGSLWQQVAIPHLLEQIASEGHVVAQCTEENEEEDENFIRLEGRYQWSPHEFLTMKHVAIECRRGNAAFLLTGNAKMDAELELQEADFALAFHDMADFSDLSPVTVAGSLAAQGQVDGPWSHPKIDLEVKSFDLSVNDKKLGDAHLQGKVNCSSDSIVGSLALCCQVGSIATNSTFDVYWDYGDKISLHDLQWQSPTASLRGNVDFWLPSLLTSGHLEGETGDIAWLIEQYPSEIHGTGVLTIDLIPEHQLGQQSLRFALEMEGLSLANLWSERISLTAHLDNLYSAPYGSIKAMAKEIRFGTTRLKEMTGEAILPKDGAPWRYFIEANGRWESKLRIKASGTAEPYASTPHMTVDTLIGKLHSYPLLLIDPLNIAWESDHTTMLPFTLQIGKGQLTASGSYGADVDLSLRLKQLPIDILKELISQVPGQGYLSGELHVKGAPDSPSAQFRVHADGVDVSSDGIFNIPQLQAKAEGSLIDNLLTVKGDVVGIGEKPVTVALQLPLHLSLTPFSVDIIKDSPLKAKVDAAGEVSPLVQLLTPSVTGLTGQARIAIDITGTYQAPLVNGFLDLRNSTYEGMESGSTLRHIQAQFEGRGTEIALTNLSAEDLQGGSIAGRGTIHLDLAHKFPFDIAVQLNRLHILSRDYLQASASGLVHLTGDLEDIELNGNLTVDHMLVTIPKEMPTAAASLEVTFVNAPKAKQPSATLAEAKPGHPIHFNIKTDIPDTAILRSEELLSEWRGNVTIHGTSAAPLYSGELRVVKGDYRLNGKTFTLDKGTISFAGDFEKKTTLYIVAVHPIDRYTIQAVLKGPIKTPQLALRSNPHLSQREILSWIIFNRALNDITPLENDQAGQAVVDLSNTNASTAPDIMGRLRRLGIDRIEFSSDPDADSHDLSVNIGKYLFRDVYISLNKGLTTDANSVKVEANVIRNVKFQAEVDDEAAGGVSLMWKRDY